MKRYKVALDKRERDTLESIVRKGSHRSRKVVNALILLTCDEGEFQTRPTRNKELASFLRISMRKIDRVKKRFTEEGLDAALGHYRKKVDDRLGERLVALSCTAPPDGIARWSVRLLADRAVQLGYIESISRETVRQLLRKQNQAPGKARPVYSAERKLEAGGR